MKKGSIRKQLSRIVDQRSASSSSSSSSAPASNWYTDVQRHLSMNSMLEDHALVSRMYKEMTKIHDSSPLGMDDPDAIAYANAYLAAIDRGKHGIEVLLPDHLRKVIGL